MNIQVFSDAAQLNAAAARVIAGELRRHPRTVLGLATGGTPIGIYNELIGLYNQGEVSFAQATSFNLDEYIHLPANHPESYRTYMRERLLRHIDLPQQRAHIPDGNAADALQECERYERLLAECGGIDVQLLGLGHNGHIGFNEPGEQLDSRTHVAALKPETRAANARFFGSPDDVPSHAITMGLGHIMKAKLALLVATGDDKAGIVAQALTGPVTPNCPASLLQLHPNVLVLLDQAAAGSLPVHVETNA